MAKIKKTKQSPPKSIDKFLGINEDTAGETQLNLGESPYMVNWRLTENFKPRKREGYLSLFDSLGAYSIRGMWYGKLNGSYHFLFATNGKLYKHNLSTGVNTEIGTLTDAPTYFFGMNGKVYLLNGNEYKYYDGTTFAEVAGYIPLVAVATPPAGGGTPLEGINQLTGKKHQQFSADGIATEYQLAELSVASIDSVYVGGVLKTVTTDYTINLTTGKVTFTVAPTTGQNNVDIYWTKANNDRSVIEGCTYAMFFGGKNDTRIFIYGNGTNKYYYSDLASGVPSAEYFPVNNYRKISSDEYQVTDIVRQYDRQIIYTNGGEAWYSYYDPFTDTTGATIIDFPTYPLNNVKGNIAKGQSRLINNNPVTIQDGVYEWRATDVRDERNFEYISKRVQPSLDGVDLSTALTVDWESRREYWLTVGKNVWVWNYYLNVWYKFELYDTITSFLLVDDTLYFGTSNGQIMKFDADTKTDNGQLINATWEMHFYDFDAEYLTKFVNEFWLSLKPEDRTSLDVYFQTNKDPKTLIGTAKYNLATYVSVDYGSFSYLTSYNPQPFKFRAKAKKFVYFKLIVENNKAEKVTLLSINIPTRYGGKSR